MASYYPPMSASGWTECEYCHMRYCEDRDAHIRFCVLHPTPCPNQCGIGLVPEYKLNDHIAECPLEPVKCEFRDAGCEEMVPRREMAKHLKERAQEHLLKATLLNLSLTKEIKEEQMAARRRPPGIDLEGIEEMVEQMQRIKLEEMEEKIGKLEAKMKQQDMRTFDFTLTDYVPSSTDWYSDSFYVPTRDHYKFRLNIDNGDEDNGAWLKVLKGKNDGTLSWPFTVEGQLTVLNQLGDHGHHSEGFSVTVPKAGEHVFLRRLIPPADLGYNAKQGTQYLKEDRLCFRLYIRVVGADDE